MYYLEKHLEISAAHRLNLNYKSKCSNLHGHNWLIAVYCRSQTLDENGMVMDFTLIKQRIQDVLDHSCLNDLIPAIPTAENIARWIAESLGEKCYKVKVQESEGNIVTYEAD